MINSVMAMRSYNLLRSFNTPDHIPYTRVSGVHS